jgi:hypothetical protein
MKTVFTCQDHLSSDGNLVVPWPAATLIAELGDLPRFENPGKLIAFRRLVSSERFSGRQKREVNITKSDKTAPKIGGNVNFNKVNLDFTKSIDPD